jgi:hypothetical protein
MDVTSGARRHVFAPNDHPRTLRDSSVPAVPQNDLFLKRADPTERIQVILSERRERRISTILAKTTPKSTPFPIFASAPIKETHPESTCFAALQSQGSLRVTVHRAEVPIPRASTNAVSTVILAQKNRTLSSRAERACEWRSGIYTAVEESTPGSAPPPTGPFLLSRAPLSRLDRSRLGAPKALGAWPG